MRDRLGDLDGRRISEDRRIPFIDEDEEQKKRKGRKGI
jgi:hypothetical protein